MPTPASLIFILSALALATAPIDAQDQPATAKVGAHFQVIVHFEDATLADEALRTVESAWSIATKALYAKDEPPATPLEVHLYRDNAAYEAADARLTKGEFKRELAFVHWETKSAHVALQPPCSDEALRAIGLPAQTRRVLAYEASLLTRYQHLPNFAEHPGWFADGLASWVQDQVMIAGHWSTGIESDPDPSTAIFLVKKLIDNAKAPRAKDLFSDRVDDEVEAHDRYSARRVFFAFLKGEKNAARFEKIVTAIRQTKTGPKYKQQVLEAVDKAIGDPKALDKEFQGFVSALKPRWEEVYRSLVTLEEDWPQIAFADANAIAWRNERIKAPGFTATGGLRILPGKEQQMNFLFGRSASGFFCISFGAGVGINLFKYEKKADSWTELGKAEYDGLRPGIVSSFKIDITGDNLAVQVDGKDLLAMRLPEKLTELQWGLGAQSGSAGIWSSIKVGPASSGK